MIGILPRTDLPPLEYRCALDALMPLFHTSGRPEVICRLPALKVEIDQRFPELPSTSRPRNGLWVEPMQASWYDDLQDLTSRLGAGDTLVVLASRPTARWLPERRGWPGRPLGLQLAGLSYLHEALIRIGYHRREVYGMHSMAAVWLNFLAQIADRWARPDFADRLRFSARLKYIQQGLPVSLCTIALLFYSKRPRL